MSDKAAGRVRRIILRILTGIVLISAMNLAFEQSEVNVSVGINAYSIVTAGVLGVPGVVMLYGIEGCQFL